MGSHPDNFRSNDCFEVTGSSRNALSCWRREQHMHRGGIIYSKQREKKNRTACARYDFIWADRKYTLFHSRAVFGHKLSVSGTKRRSLWPKTSVTYTKKVRSAPTVTILVSEEAKVKFHIWVQNWFQLDRNWFQNQVDTPDGLIWVKFTVRQANKLPLSALVNHLHAMSAIFFILGASRKLKWRNQSEVSPPVVILSL